MTAVFPFSVDERNAEQVQQLLQEYLAENTAYTDSALPDFIVTMVQNGRNKAEVTTALEEFLGDGVTKVMTWITEELPKSYKAVPNEDKVDFGQDEPAEDVHRSDEEAPVASIAVLASKGDTGRENDDYNSRERARQRRERFGGEEGREREENGRGGRGRQEYGRGRGGEEFGRRQDRWNNERERGRGRGFESRERRERDEGDTKSVQRRSNDRRGNNVSFTVRLDTKNSGNDRDSEMTERMTRKRSMTERLEGDSGEGNDGNHTADDSLSLGQPSKVQRTNTPKCTFWPYCSKGDACPFFHPSQPCTRFPNCKFGDKCLFIHPAGGQQQRNAPAKRFAHAAPPCRYGFSCHRRTSGCTFSHPAVSCRFGDGCTRKATCKFGHGVTCRYGVRCSRAGCSFSHGASASASSAGAEESTAEADITALDAGLPSTPPRDGNESSAPGEKEDTNAVGQTETAVDSEQDSSPPATAAPEKESTSEPKDRPAN